MELLAIALALSASPLWCYIYMELLAVCIHVVIVTWNTLTGSFFCCLRCTCFMGAPHSRKLYFICAVHRTLGAQPLCGGTETIRSTTPFVVVQRQYAAPHPLWWYVQRQYAQEFTDHRSMAFLDTMTMIMM